MPDRPAPVELERVDQHYMRRALELAALAGERGEVPVGAVLVRGGEVLGEGFNHVIGRSDPSAHAEILALRDAAEREGNYRLPETTLYVTLEPCTMCLGALVHARVACLVFAAREPRAGAVCSAARLLDADYYNHRVSWREGPLAEESAERLRAFFRERRAQA
jgi:tRNA(adenine34) deaminase